MGCGAIRPKRELVRLALDGDALVVDRDAGRGGRGAYVCNRSCMELALAKRAFPRAFRRPVRATPDALESLRT